MLPWNRKDRRENCLSHGSCSCVYIIQYTLYIANSFATIPFPVSLLLSNIRMKSREHLILFQTVYERTNARYQLLLYPFISSLSSLLFTYWTKQAHTLHLVYEYTQNCFDFFSLVQLHLSEKTHRCTWCNVICLNAFCCYNEIVLLYI